MKKTALLGVVGSFLWLFTICMDLLFCILYVSVHLQTIINFCVKLSASISLIVFMLNFYKNAKI